MRQVYFYLRNYLRDHFDCKAYATIAVFLALCFVFNYHYDFEDGVVDSYRGNWPAYFLAMFAFMGFPYACICMILAAFGMVNIKSTHLWLKFLIGFTILSIDRTYSATVLIPDGLPHTDYRFYLKCLNWGSNVLVTVLPLYMVYLFTDRDQPFCYGLNTNKFNPKPYLQLLGLAALAIFIGSFLGDLQRYYPRYLHSSGNAYATAHDLPAWVTMLMYEIAYGSSFIPVEVFFRGFLIYGFTRWLGPHAVLPMIGCYAFLHFGKPISEAVSSVFGGFILGVIALNARSVWGGIIIHLGVAWAMELFGYLQRIWHAD